MKLSKSFFSSLYLFFTTIFFVRISLYLIKNPDLDAYKSLLRTSSEFSLNIEPTILLFSSISYFFYDLLAIEPIQFFYFQYIYLIQLFLFLGFYNLTNRSFILSNLLLGLWLLMYGTLHALVQIRFGLANALFVYAFSLIFTDTKKIKIYILSVLAFFTHYSSALAIGSLNIIRLKSDFLKINIIVHLFFILFLLFFKFGHILNFLPPFMMARLSGYLNGDDLSNVSNSNASILMSLICYIILILTPKLSDPKLNALKIYGSLGFLPYFLVPDLGIIVRLGIPFQYLLLPYLILTFKYKKIFFFSTLPLVLFYLYKIYSNSNIFLIYLN